MTDEKKAALFYELVFLPSHASIWITSPGFPDSKSKVQVNVECITSLKIPSGRIIACDPTEAMFPEDCPPFKVRFPRGSWPLFLALCEVPSSNFNEHSKICLGAIVRFGEKEPVSWQMALCRGQSLSKLKNGQFYGYSVDSGEACLMDAQALPAWGQIVDISNGAASEHAWALVDEEWRDVAVKGEDGTEANVVLFTSGYGDGCYPSFIGYDDSKAICALLTMFDVFDADTNATG